MRRAGGMSFLFAKIMRARLRSTGNVTLRSRSPMKSLRLLLLAFAVAISTLDATQATPSSSGRATNVKVAPPPPVKLYDGFYWGGVGTDNHDPTEHDLTPSDVARYEQ